jgi:hypothetical protein
VRLYLLQLVVAQTAIPLLHIHAPATLVPQVPLAPQVLLKVYVKEMAISISEIMEVLLIVAIKHVESADIKSLVVLQTLPLQSVIVCN